MDNTPEIPSALEVRLYDFESFSDGSFRLWLELEENRYLALDVMAGSDASDQILELLTELATQALSEMGRRGVVITGFSTPKSSSDEEDEASE
jgi:hypothetical protein